MSSALAELDRLLRALDPAERRVARVLLPHVLSGDGTRATVLGGTRVTVAIPEGASELGEAVLGALLALPAVQVDALSPEAVKVTYLASEGTVEVRVVSAEKVPLIHELEMPPVVKAVYDLLVQVDEHGLVVAEAARRLDMTGYQVSTSLQNLRRRGLAVCAKEGPISRWGITQDAAEHALALALGRPPRASSSK